MRYLNTDTGELIEFEWKTPYNHNTNAESIRTGLECKDQSLAQQHQAKEADINTIVKNFGVTGQLSQIPLPPSLDEFGEIFDFQSAMNIQAEARASFMMLPAEVRNAFYNDPHNFVSQVDAMLNEQDQTRRARNLEDLRLLGLAVEPGPKADTTTLGDLLAAIKANSAPPKEGPKEAPKETPTGL